MRRERLAQERRERAVRRAAERRREERERKREAQRKHTEARSHDDADADDHDSAGDHDPDDHLAHDDLDDPGRPASRPGDPLGRSTVGKQRDPCTVSLAGLGSERQEQMATPLEIEELEPREGEVRMLLRGELDVGSADAGAGSPRRDCPGGLAG